MPDFAGGQVVIQDAYLNVNYVPVGARHRPASTRRRSASSACSRPTRSCSSSARCPTTSSPTAISASCSGASRSTARWSTSSAIMNGVADGGSNNSDIDFNDDKTFAGRLFFQPFKDSPGSVARGFGVGFAGTYGRQQGLGRQPAALPAYRTDGQQNFFTYVVNSPAPAADGTAVADGNQWRISPQGYLLLGPGRLDVGVGAVEQRRSALSGNATQHHRRLLADAVVVGAHRRGQHATRPIVPARNFDPWTFLDGNWGAFELAGRYAEPRRRATTSTRLGFADPEQVRAQGQGVGHRRQLVPEPDGPPHARLRPHAPSPAAPRTAAIGRPKT